MTRVSLNLLIVLTVSIVACSENLSNSKTNTNQNNLMVTKFPRCAGSYEPKKCEAIEEMLAKETPEQRLIRQKSLESEVSAASLVVAQEPVSVDQEPQITIAETPERVWYSHDINHQNCIKAMSPAKMMRELQSYGKYPKVQDLKEGVVRVSNDIGNGRSDSWTFYPNDALCFSTLPKSIHIDQKYE